MHGSLFHGFKQFVLGRDGKEGWDAIVRGAGVGGWYHSTHLYPDEEMFALVRATAAHEGRSVGVVLEEFGTALVPTLMSLYRAFVRPAWRTLDLLVNVEVVIHRTVRMKNPAADPPHLQARRISEREVHVDYASERRLCSLAVGICRGVALHYAESVTIEHPQCMASGAPTCRLVVRLADNAPSS